MAPITERETQQIEQANASGKTPVVFIHGLWLLPSSWDRWAALFEEAGYAPVTPVWPDDPETVEQARANPEVPEIVCERTCHRWRPALVDPGRAVAADGAYDVVGASPSVRV
jgi:pimeloyl-ACP methyl ester carboxylesterase